MEEWPDDHLDDLFRKSAEESDIPFNANDWVEMSRRLDEHDRRSLFDRISRWGGVGALFLLLMIGLSWLNPGDGLMDKRHPTGTENQMPAGKIATASPVKNAGNELVTKKSQPKKNQLTKALPGNPVLAERAIPNTQRIRPKGSVDKTIPNTNTPARQGTTKIDDWQASVRVAQYAPKRRKQPANLPDEPPRFVPEKTVSRSEPAVSGTLPANRIRPETSGGNVPDVETSEALAVNSPAQTNVLQSEAEIDGRWLPRLTLVTSLTALVEQQLRSFPEPVFQEVTVSLPTRQQTVPRLSGLSIALHASPDLSGIGLINFERPGSNAGLAVQYQLTNRLSINVGAMYSTKRYHTSANNYVWPAYTQMEVWPSGIYGTCKMIDVPLNFRYDWLLRPRAGGRAPARWFASTGLTSYFIQREVYNYEYANPKDPRIKTHGWDNQRAGRPGGSFGFSNLNISLGYEQPITQRLSWQVEPFMKVPLQEVGYFRIKLLSTGVLMGVRYRL